MNPRYPVYVISKGRWKSRLTVRALERMHVPHSVVIEPQERDAYAAVMDPAKLLVLPFSNLGQGSIPARNFVWDHSAASGCGRHWILDDNILGFHRLNHNLKLPVHTGSTFAAAEDFVDRYENVAISGMQYFMFAPARAVHAPMILNTRIYSCILIKNDIPYRWRGRYNEDTDLSIRALKDGWATVLFNTFLADKMTTMTMKGGNTDQLYAAEGRRKMAESLKEQHPDIVTITWKWNRWQHQVDYSAFAKNELKLKPGAVVPDGVNNYGMVLEIDGERLTGNEEADHARVEEALKGEADRERDARANGKPSGKKGFQDAAEAGRISNGDWCDILNAGTSSGATFEEINAAIFAKFGSKVRELKAGQLVEALALARSLTPSAKPAREALPTPAPKPEPAARDRQALTNSVLDDKKYLAKPENQVGGPKSAIDSASKPDGEAPPEPEPAISNGQWCDILNAANVSGRDANKLIRDRFGVKIRELKKYQFVEAMAMVREMR